MPVQGPRGQRIPSFRSHISRIPLSYFTRCSPPPPTTTRPFRPVPHFLLSHFSASSSPSTPLPRLFVALEREREGPALSLDASLWMNIARQPSLSRLLCTDVLIMSTSRNTLCKYHIYAVEGGSLESVQGGERPTGRKFLIFSLWGREPSGRFFRFNRNEAYRSIFQSYNWSSYLDDLIVQSKKHGLGSDGFPISKRRIYISNWEARRKSYGSIDIRAGKGELLFKKKKIHLRIETLSSINSSPLNLIWRRYYRNPRPTLIAVKRIPRG